MTETSKNVIASCMTLAVVIALFVSVLFIIGVSFVVVGWS